MRVSLFTLPEQSQRIIQISLVKIPQDHFEYLKLPIACHYFGDGTQINGVCRLDEFADELRPSLELLAVSFRKRWKIPRSSRSSSPAFQCIVRCIKLGLGPIPDAFESVI